MRMIRQSELLHATVVDSATGKVLGRLQSIDFALNSDAVVGLTYYKTNLLRKKTFVPSGCIDWLGDFVLVRVPTKGIRRPADLFQLDERPQAVDADGNPVGYVVDCFVDEQGKRIQALEVSVGFFEDIAGRRLYAPRFAPRSYSSDVIVQLAPYQEGSV